LFDADDLPQQNHDGLIVLRADTAVQRRKERFTRTKREE
jgi:hypothetical protein